ncbi:MAG: ABC transporter permease [Hyphomicrobiales bacterium]
MTDSMIAGQAAPRASRKIWPAELNALIGLVAIMILFEVIGWIVVDQSFLMNKLRLSILITQVAVVGILAVGVTQVIISGGIDLSGGSIIGATAMIAMSFAQVGTNQRAVYFAHGWVDLPIIVPILAGLTVALLCGMINGLLIAYVKLPSFIATLGMMVSARGVALWYTKGQPLSFPTENFMAIGDGLMPVWIFIGVALLFSLILKFTVYGRHTYAIGSNEASARMSGINVERHLLLVYVISALLAGLAGLVLIARAQTAQPVFGTMNELDAIAMAVIGGVSLSGGRGSILGTALGMLIFGVIFSGFIFLSVDAYYQNMVKGAIIVGAVALDQWRQKRQAREV